MLPSARMRSIGWAMVLAICITVFVGLTFQVNSVKSQVRLAERRIVSLEREKLLLETEFETRASQQQLASWNTVEFGYRAPRADQFLENERQLAALGTPRAVGAPAPIRVAVADVPGEAEEGFPSMVSPLTGKAFAAEINQQADQPRIQHHEDEGESLSGRLTRGAARIVLSARAEAVE